MNLSSHSFRRTAFSLIELIVVIAIIAIIATFTVPAATQILRGTAMTQAQQMLTDQFRLARQTALTRGRAVEIRFYQYADPEQPGETLNLPTSGQYRGLQIFDILENGSAIPLDKPQRFPSTVIMNQTSKLSTILMVTSAGSQGGTIAPRTPTTKDPDLPRGVGKNYRYVSLRFQPDGSTTLTATGSVPWFLTIHNLSDGPAIQTPPANFFTIQLDPISGSIKGYRPSAG
jgi:uncharacterized protein (TIGR02596 family)